MTTTILSRFERTKRGYSFLDSYKACLDSSSENCSGIEAHMNGLIQQLQRYPDEPTAWSHAEWKRKGCSQDGINFIGANAIVLEYRLGRDDTEIVQRLHDKAAKLGWTFGMLDTENKQGNSISVVWYLTSLVNEAQYGRLASILAYEMDEYEMSDGSLAATHLIHVHHLTTPIVVQGIALDPEKEIKRTAKMYQNINARRFESKRPTGLPITQAYEEPQAIEDGLFVFYETAEEKRQREAIAVMAQYGFKGCPSAL